MRIVGDNIYQRGIIIKEFSTDGTLADNSDTALCTEQAIKTYVDGRRFIYSSIVNTTSGTSVTLSSSIPSDVREIEILFNGISTNTNSQPPIVRLGDAGGIETTGYVGVVKGPTGETSVTDSFRPFRSNAWSAADVLYGRMRMIRWDPSLHTWFADGLAQEGSNISSFSGYKTTSEVLTTIILTTPGGTATFDLGSARIRYR